MVNVLNPKAALYFVALFTTFVPADASNLFLLYLAIAVVITTALRFVLIANIIGLPVVRAWFVRYTKWINRICG
jgi:threonine/homoserine/homoserine lactone efflux protein